MCEKKKKELFDIPDAGKENELMVETHFYNWLKTNYHDNRLITLQRYLKSIGFNRETHRLWESDLSLLRTVYDYYFYIEIRPTLEKPKRPIGGY